MRFRAVLELHDKTATGIQVPPEVVEGLGSHQRPAVRVTIGSHTYLSTIAARGGVFLLGVSEQSRVGAGIAAGDEVEVDLALDTEPREVIVPPDLAAALDRDPDLRRTFDKLAFTHRKEHVRAIEDAKTAQTRQRRITKAIMMLSEGRG